MTPADSFAYCDSGPHISERGCEVLSVRRNETPTPGNAGMNSKCYIKL